MYLFVIVGLLLAVLVLLELYMLVLVRTPALLCRCPQSIINSMGHLYIFSGERRIMQFLRGCGCFDADLGYILNQGEFVFSGREFCNRYRINSLGVRDDESSLDHPEVVVVGDSFALGWGVEQDEMFSNVLKRMLGIDVLNTAVPSYGTVREMKMLQRVNREHMKFLIIQYCNDDYEENRDFYLNGNLLKTMRRETFEKYVDIHSSYKKYYFGKYLKLKLDKKIHEAKERREKKREKKNITSIPVDKDEAELFLHAIINSGLDLSGVQIIAFEMNGKNQMNVFTSTLKERIAGGIYPQYIRRMIVLDMSEYLRRDNFYILDDHLTPEGNRVVAEVLLRTINQIAAPISDQR
jgi:hypothetical protein